VAAATATEAPLTGERHGAAPDAQGPPLDERFGHLAPGGLDDPRECRARDPHPAGGLILVQALEIRQPQGLELVDAQRDLLESTQRDAGGLEVADPRGSDHPARAMRSRHLSVRA
jgi:hypothetical protein